MRLATHRSGGRDGTLLLVVDASDGGFIATHAPVPTLQQALDDWSEAERTLRAAYARLSDAPRRGERLDLRELAAPLPRAYQWAEGSTYLPHMERLRAARGKPLPPGHGVDPAVYENGSDAFLGPFDPIPLGDEAWGLDLEATVAVITDDVPEGTVRADAGAHVKLVALANDLTFRHLLAKEYAVGVGFYQAKPARPLAPFVVTPDALGASWAEGMLRAIVRCWIGDDLLGAVDTGRDGAFTFPDLIAHMTRTRALGAGTMIGSGTVANRDPAAGFACLAERRAAEPAGIAAATPLLRIGDRVRIEAFGAHDRSLFGPLDQLVVRSGKDRS